MPQERHFTYRSADGLTDIHAIEWTPDGKVRGVVQIVHGMQEFIDRYADFARYLNGLGFVVTGNDHLGHGGSIRSENYFGYFAEKDGNGRVIADIRRLFRLTREKYQGVPYFLLGHSMGSFLARQYLCLYGSSLTGAVISGTAWHPAPECLFGMGLCRLLAAIKGWRYRSELINNIAMGGYTKRIHPLRTPQDWLTRDTKIVDEYRADKRTQFIFTLNAYYNMFKGLYFISRRANVKRVPSSLPVFFIAGEEDPVGSYGAGVKRAAMSMREAGVRDVVCRLYPQDRHEVLNELNKEEVYKDIAGWMAAHMPAV